MSIIPESIQNLIDEFAKLPGIGPKTAIGLLDKYHSVDSIYTHLQDINPNVRRKLEINKDNAKLFHRLATIVRDVPIKIDFPEMNRWKVDSPSVLKLFEEFGFRTLTERIKKVGKSIEEENQGSLF